MRDSGHTRSQRLMSPEDIERTLRGIARGIAEIEGGFDDLALVGIRRRGVPLAQRLQHLLSPSRPDAIPLGQLDITLYRDDLSSLGPQPIIGPTDLPFDVDGRTIVLVDDVIFTGRTVRAALEALVSYGRPHAVRLAVLVDRGHREYPIQPDAVGLRVETDPNQVIEVRLTETDGQECVDLLTPDPSPPTEA
ncbi:bifunctional pyr operon transcriptional regulator/uracil phosphoribosyltransferase PyrR [Candidatus Sumerlaeota bacterium]|nr:bifunctional pyr operon transcriptional regulator/uracil phosphoribosyltransferase PyrR [Candidatus Sumerlaeota bacterium]